MKKQVAIRKRGLLSMSTRNSKPDLR